MTKFNDLALDPKVLKAVSEAGYETPTPIQVQAIPHALEGRDVLGIAQTGTGKTASFVLPMITHLSKGRARARMPRSLVLAPTRELAAQVAENFEKYSRHVKLSMALLIGGVSFKDQDKLIDRGVDVLIATPGRLLDHFERGKLMLTGVQIMVVDEADRMLDMGFIPDIERIFKLVPFTRQTLFFSATMAPEITRITQEFLHNPVRVEVARQATTSETIDQYVCKHTPKRRDGADRDKREVLRRLIRGEGETLTNGIIFCNRKRDVDVVAKSLKKHGFDAAPLHGDLEQSMRMKILGDFRDGALKVLVASDVAARGLDIPTVSHVINFDVPIHSEDYVHRIGRTGRAGRAGKAITICFPHEEKYLAKIEELVKKSIPILPSPLGATETAGDEETDAAAPAPRRSERARRSESRRPEARAGDDRGDTRTRTQSEPSRPEPSRTRGDKAERGGRQGRREDRSSVIGMGDHVPAFLMREFRLDPPLAATPTAPEPAAKPARRRAAAKADPVEAETVVTEPMVEDAANGTAAEVIASEPVVETPAATAESRAAEAPEASAPEAEAADPALPAGEAEATSGAEAGVTDLLPTEPVEAETVAAEAGAEDTESPAPAKKPRAPRRRVTARAKAAEVEQTAPAA